VAVFFDGPLDWNVTIDANAGDSFWVVCIVHGANMRMKVNVVANAAAASDPAALDQANARALAQDTNTAAALNEKFSDRQTWHVAPGGRRVWDAWAGVDSRHVALYEFYPRALHIARGDTVQWHFDSLSFEDHTVTFPLAKAKDIANTFNIACDPDGDAGPGPDNPPDQPMPPFCNVPAQVEFQVSNKFIPEQGDGTFTGRDLESSGVRGVSSSEFEGDANYNLQFGASSSGTGFKYICMIHPFMHGRVVVR
jgi:plastocyanin